ncbi:hypothetical protein BDR07DRAFT_1429586 [Suillus spraguei]|nr:hypothetical protein BDR07DRAFT_1438442 [Suillus spraguei]KAG2354398.1 hypothetical protein BDR07DRAFT_1429586 [Suillus spraguei]
MASRGPFNLECAIWEEHQRRDMSAFATYLIQYHVFRSNGMAHQSSMRRWHGTGIFVNAAIILHMATSDSSLYTYKIIKHNQGQTVLVIAFFRQLLQPAGCENKDRSLIAIQRG